MTTGIALPVDGSFEMTAPLFPIFILTVSVEVEAPEHAEADLVARLDKVRCGIGSHQRFK